MAAALHPAIGRVDAGRVDRAYDPRRVAARAPEQEPRPRRHGLRRRDDLHRPDDRRDRDPRHRAGPRRSRPTGAQWIINGYLLVARRRSSPSAAGSATSSGAGAWSSIGVDRLRRRLGAVRRDADGRARRGVADLLPRRAGRVRGAACSRRRSASSWRRSRCASAARRWRSSSAISGGLTAIGPLAGGFLTQWTWRAIFWINIPVALIALYLIWRSKPTTRSIRRRSTTAAPCSSRGGDGAARARPPAGEHRGAGARRDVGVHRRSARRIAVAFVLYGAAHRHPLLRPADLPQPRASRSTRRARAALDRVRPVLLLRAASTRRCRSASRPPTPASTSCTSSSASWSRPSSAAGSSTSAARGPSVVLGAAIAAVGFFLLAGKLDDLSIGYAVVGDHDRGRRHRPDARARSTDAVNRAPDTSYSEVTGITQTARNFGASLGLAVLGTILIAQNKTNIDGRAGEARRPARRRPRRLRPSAGGGSGGGSAARAPRSSTTSRPRSRTRPRPCST